MPQKVITGTSAQILILNPSSYLLEGNINIARCCFNLNDKTIILSSVFHFPTKLNLT